MLWVSILLLVLCQGSHVQATQSAQAKAALIPASSLQAGSETLSAVQSNHQMWSSLLAISAKPDFKTLLVAVCTAPRNTAQRTAIRKTWANIDLHKAITAQFRFFVAKVDTGDTQADSETLQRLHDEAITNKDMVFLDSFIDSYSNLTHKTLGMIEYAVEGRYEVMMKVDDDSFVVLDNFVFDVLMSEPQRELMYWGKFWGSDDRPVNRNAKSKFYVSNSEYPNPSFPNYADGPCYALGRELLREIVKQKSSLHMYSLEDAAVGLWLLSSPVAYNQIHGDAYMYLRNCPEGNYYYYINPVTPTEMERLMTSYHNHEDLCSHGFSLSVCDSPTKGCLCSPSEKSCWGDQ